MTRQEARSGEAATGTDKQPERSGQAATGTTDIVLPFALARSASGDPAGTMGPFRSRNVVGRLAPGVSIGTARAEGWKDAYPRFRAVRDGIEAR